MIEEMSFLRQNGEYDEKYDVVALGELLIDFTENGKVIRETHFLRQIQEAHPAMYLQC